MTTQESQWWKLFRLSEPEGKSLTQALRQWSSSLPRDIELTETTEVDHRSSDCTEREVYTGSVTLHTTRLFDDGSDTETVQFEVRPKASILLLSATAPPSPTGGASYRDADVQETFVDGFDVHPLVPSRSGVWEFISTTTGPESEVYIITPSGCVEPLTEFSTGSPDARNYDAYPVDRAELYPHPGDRAGETPVHYISGHELSLPRDGNIREYTLQVVEDTFF